MIGSRRRVGCSVDGRVLTAWEGVSVRELLAQYRPDAVHAVTAGRARVVDGGGRTVDMSREIADGDTLSIQPVPHPGRKPM